MIFFLIVSPCASSPCQNGGTCTVVGSGYQCTCPTLYFGIDCQYMTAGKNLQNKV